MLTVAKTQAAACMAPIAQKRPVKSSDMLGHNPWLQALIPGLTFSTISAAIACSNRTHLS
jgi:hypothetical protein